jgi:3-oxoadipate enol-lactonase
MGSVVTSRGRIGIAVKEGGADTAILFLHGVGSTKEVWRPQLDHFGGQHTAIAIDYPGYGESEFRAGATRDDFARAAVAALDAMGVERAHICGLSLGGVVAIALHALAPDRCASLILADTFAVHPDGRAIYERSVAGSADMRAFAEARVDALLASPADPAVRSKVIETMASINPEAYRIGAEAVWLADQRDRVPEIAVSTLIVCGEEDRPTPPELSRELHQLIPHSRLEMIANAGHLTNLERPTDFNRIVEEFISGAD